MRPRTTVSLGLFAVLLGVWMVGAEAPSTRTAGAALLGGGALVLGAKRTP